jgi:hypothetical protein
MEDVGLKMAQISIAQGLDEGSQGSNEGLLRNCKGSDKGLQGVQQG